jgi:hypothetical protein
MSDTFRVSNIYTSTVGIGTTTTTSILSVVGSTTVYNGNGQLSLTNTNTNPQGVMYILGPNMTANTQIGFPFGSALTTYNSINTGFYYIGLGSTSNYYQINSYGNPNPGLVVTTGGNVGIGTTNPSAPLHVVSASTTWVNLATLYSPNVTTQGCLIVLGKAATANNSLSIQYNHISDGSSNNFGCLQMATVGNILNWTAGGYIGIGVTNPNTYLCVGPNGGVNQSGNLPGISMTSSSGQTMAFSVGQGTSGTNNLLMAWVYNATASSGYGQLSCYGGNNSLILQGSGGNVGIATASPGGKFHVYEATGTAPTGSAGSIVLSHGNSNGTQSIIFMSNTNSGSDYGFIQFIDTVTATGFTGYNYFSGAGAEVAALVIGCQNDTVTGAGPDSVIIAAGSIVLDPTQGAGTASSPPRTYMLGNVGMGVTNPGATLCVGGTTTNCNGIIQVVSNSGNGGKNQDGIGLQAYIDTNYIIVFANSAGTIRGQIQGANSSSVTYSTSSDQRRKTNVQDMPSMISKIKQLKPRTYTWKESGDKDDGFVAQEVHKVFPQFRSGYQSYCDICHHTYNDLYDGITCECCDFENPVDKDGKPHYYGLDYGKFTPYLTKALQETIEILENQQKIITQQEQMLSSQSQQIADLQTQMATILARLHTAGIA